MEDNASQPTKQIQLSPTHSGNGGLRGGGVKQRLVRDETLASFGNKLESRIGPVMLFCLVTVATVLVINALYHESANGTLVELIEGIKREILELQQREVAQFVGIEGSTTTTLIPEIIYNTSITEDNESISEETLPTTQSTTDSLRPIVLKRTEQMAELSSYKERFRETDQKIILIILICVLGILLSFCGIVIECRRRSNIQPSKGSRIAYGMILAVICFLLIIQLLMFLITLLPNAFAFHSIVDKLLDFYLSSEVQEEKRQALIDPIENSFGCKLKVEHHLLEQLGVQEPCAPKIKDRLLAPYIILFLILIVLSPFLYAIFIIIWSKKLKDVKPILNARQKVAANNETRLKRFKERMEQI